MTILYVLPSNTSSRKAKAYLMSLKQSFVVRDMKSNPLSLNELKTILSYTENGTDDIIAAGKVRKALEDVGVDFNQLKLSEFHYIVTKHPRLIKAPIVIGKGQMIIGFNDEDYEVFIPRSLRNKSAKERLKKVRENEKRITI